MGKINQVAIVFVNLEEQSDRSSTETILGYSKNDYHFCLICL